MFEGMGKPIMAMCLGLAWGMQGDALAKKGQPCSNQCHAERAVAWTAQLMQLSLLVT